MCHDVAVGAKCLSPLPPLLLHVLCCWRCVAEAGYQLSVALPMYGGVVHQMCPTLRSAGPLLKVIRMCRICRLNSLKPDDGPPVPKVVLA